VLLFLAAPLSLAVVRVARSPATCYDRTMRVTNKQILIGASAIAGILFVLSSIWAGFFLQLPSDPSLSLEYLKFVLEVYKAIGIGFLIALLGLLIPNILPEAKYEFDKLKDGREIYSNTNSL
jgi:hypothetical protein